MNNTESGLHGYSFTSPEAKLRMIDILEAVKAAPEQKITSREVAALIKRSQPVACTYLMGMVDKGLLILLQRRKGVGNEYGLGQTQLDPNGTTRRRAREPEVVPVDPMRQFLFGHLR